VTVAVPALSAAAERTLLAAAEEAVRARLEGRDRRPVDDSAGREVTDPGASFVTLREDGRLLGCVGTMVPRQALIDDVAGNAVNAAFADPRLPSLQPEEFARMEIKVSVLGPLEPMDVASLPELRSAVEPDVDGLLIQAGSRRGTFLPSVWEQVRSVDRFLAMLWEKAGLRPGSWPRNLEILRYRTLEFGTAGPREPIHYPS
jgi:AmmeMemoRadiSam system protein A